MRPANKLSKTIESSSEACSSKREPQTLAEESARFAYWQSLASVIGLIFGLFTFCTAVAAAIFARNAAVAAQQSVLVASDTSALQLRAYVHPSLFMPMQHYDPSKKAYWWSFYETVTNSGATPALDTETQIWSFVSDQAIPDGLRI